MNNENSQGLHNENSQSFKYSLLDMNFDTNFEHINEGQCNSFLYGGAYGGKHSRSIELRNFLKNIQYF
jgi:hypothetical protein